MSSNSIYTVYQILNKINHKVYIGITTKRDPVERWNRHLHVYQHGDSILYRSMRKHGIENFEFSVIEQTDSLEALKALESKYIQGQKRNKIFR
jgi:group I intron endonuclease